MFRQPEQQGVSAFLTCWELAIALICASFQFCCPACCFSSIYLLNISVVLDCRAFWQHMQGVFSFMYRIHQVFDSLAVFNSVSLVFSLSHLSLLWTDEIVNTLGEGTFGKVVQCIDHHRLVTRASAHTHQYPCLVLVFSCIPSHLPTFDLGGKSAAYMYSTSTLVYNIINNHLLTDLSL